MSATIEPTSQMAKLSVNDAQIKKLNDTVEGEEVEEILRDNTRRFCLFPIKYHEVSRIYRHLCVPSPYTHAISDLAILQEG
ncbi:hypothetical protein G6F42_027571 [Rhizopus arrhizus]|nr:hypothetical protein G6F42_027571 [Rhizopus arrhizus]